MEILNPIMDIYSNLNDYRRESVDSGLSVSPLEAARPRRNKKKKRLSSTLSATSFSDLYSLRNDVLGQGSYGRVETCVNIYTNVEYAVKIVNKDSWAFNRQKMLKEIELYYLCQGHASIIQLIEYFEEADRFYLIFEKAKGGHLLRQIQKKIRFSESEAATIVASLARALKYLHSRGIAHRDLKPENILCMEDESSAVASSVRLCDFDLCSSVQPVVTTPRLASPVGSAEYMAPEVVDVFINEDDRMYDLLDEDEEELSYDKKCDIWSLGVIAYTLLCGYLPFNGCCGQDCGWMDRNEECFRCQEDLFTAIKRGRIVFPDQHWAHISREAKDLISQLLRVDPDQRIEAADVLDHPWVMKMTATESKVVATVAPPMPLKMSPSPATLRKAMSTMATSSSSKPGALKASAKMRRQSSVVNFCPPIDFLGRCEF